MTTVKYTSINRLELLIDMKCPYCGRRIRETYMRLHASLVPHFLYEGTKKYLQHEHEKWGLKVEGGISMREYKEKLKKKLQDFSAETPADKTKTINIFFNRIKTINTIFSLIARPVPKGIMDELRAYLDLFDVSPEEIRKYFKTKEEYVDFIKKLSILKRSS